MDWKPYHNDRVIAWHPSGFHVILPKEPIEGTPVFCPTCGAIMSSVYDDMSSKKFGCCDACASTWVYPDPERWKAGWRPSPAEVEDKSLRRPI